MDATPLSFLGPLGGKRILICGVGMEAVAFALAGADVYGFDRSATRVEAIKDIARSLGLRDRTHLHVAEMEQLAFPNEFFDLAFGGRLQEDGDIGSGTRELARVMKGGGRLALAFNAESAWTRSVRRAFGSAVVGERWIGLEKERTRRSRATGRIRTDDRSITNRELYP